MNGAEAKRGTHGLRKRCPSCKKLRRFYPWTGDQESYARCFRSRRWTKVDGRWVCMFCVERARVAE